MQMDLDGAGETNRMGQDNIQANQVKILGLEKGQTSSTFSNSGTPIPTISEKLIKSLEKGLRQQPQGFSLHQDHL